MPTSKLDSTYRNLVVSKFFKKGWGKPENLKKLFEFRKVVSKRETCYPLVEADYPVTITKETNYSDSTLLEGNFISPFEQYLPGLLPQVSETAYFQILIPKKWQSSSTYKPICLHLAGTGDHVSKLRNPFFFRRRNFMAKPLIKEAGIGAILLENPFYGLRKPKDQRWSALHNVSDIFVMGGCLILESLVLFHWCKRNGFGPFGLTGISMGGHMASLAATNIPEPIVLVPCLSWTTASGVFTRGVLSSAIDWECLEEQYFKDGSYSNEIKNMVTIIDNVYLLANAANDEMCSNLIFGNNSSPSTSLKSSAIKQSALFSAGQQFAQNYPESLAHIQNLTLDKLNGREVKNDEKSSFKSGKKLECPNCVEEIKQEDRETGQKNILSSEVKSKDDFTVEKAETDDCQMKLNKPKGKLSDFLKWKNKENEKITKKESNRNISEPKYSKIDKEKFEALQFMCGIMDECTHLKNFSIPVDTELIISVTAKADGYVPRDGLTDLQDLWRGSEVRYLNTGHIRAFLLHQKFFRLAIIDAFEKLKIKYYKDAFNMVQANGEHAKQ